MFWFCLRPVFFLFLFLFFFPFCLFSFFPFKFCSSALDLIFAKSVKTIAYENDFVRRRAQLMRKDNTHRSALLGGSVRLVCTSECPL